jgi:hypothetical protein
MSRQETENFIILVSMEFNSSERHLLGFMELNGPDFHEPGKEYGK